MRWLRSPQKVFGIGLHRTGTSTLGRCLQVLGYNHCSVRRDLLVAYRGGDMARLLAEAEKFDSFEDWPWPLAYRELFEAFGSRARFILTVRKSPEVWLESLKKHSLRTHPERHCRTLAYGFDYPHGYEAEHVAFYNKHNADVQAFFADKRKALLTVCWENGDGWKELCGFLGFRIPREPFPHAQSGAEMDAKSSPDFRAKNQSQIDRQVVLLQHGH
jgi:hypothetical protein